MFNPGKGAEVLMVGVSAQEIRSQAQSALADSPIFELRDLKVESNREGLLISGNVSSFYHKQLAQEVVRAVCQDIEIDLVNSIQVQ